MQFAHAKIIRLWIFALSGILLGGLLVALPLGSTAANAHGSLSDPPSRTYTCRFLYPEDPLCQEAWDAEPQALYDWMEVNIGDANGRHQDLIPDGRLCSANRAKYAAFDTPSQDWRATPVAADDDGKYTFTWESTAPHATRYYQLYLTNNDYDPSKSLSWDDLDLVYDAGPSAAEFKPEFRTELPARTGKQVLYTIWQRSDSPEAFYSCSDVTLDGSVPPSPTPAYSPTPTPSPSTTSSPSSSATPTVTSPPSAGGNADLKLVITTDWGSGYCAEGRVTTSQVDPLAWQVSFDLHGDMTSSWSADIRLDTTKRYEATGHSWNRTVKKNSPVTFGFCVDRGKHVPPTPAPTATESAVPTPTVSETITPSPTISESPTPTVSPTTPEIEGPLSAKFRVLSDWGNGFGADLTIKNTSDKAVSPWELVFGLPQGVSVTDLWNGTHSSQGGMTTVSPAAWNGKIGAGQKVVVGFNGANTSGAQFQGLVSCSINTNACLSGGETPTPQPSTTPTSGPTPTSPTSSATPSPTLSATASKTPTVSPTTAPIPTVSPTTSVEPTPPPATSGRRVGYFTQWGIYARNYFVKDIVGSGSASKLTHLNYAFGNINSSGKCFIVNQSGEGDAWADYGRSFTAAQSVDGVADTWDQKLRGNFNQIKELKAQHPHLKALISLGGWTWSKRFSDVALTQESREKFVSSCVDLYLKGDLPAFDGAGGAGVGAGVFDGLDIDWEYPGSEGLSGNRVRPEDTKNYTLLLQEFRKQLDELQSASGQQYELTAAMPAADGKVAKYEVAKVAESLDFMNIMAYDFRGAWDSSGPTNFHSNLYADPEGPGSAELKAVSVQSAVDAWLAGGAPADKLVVGVPFYGRGWSGVAAGTGDGLYQSATGAAPGTYEAGFEDYKVLDNQPGFTRYRHPVTKQLWAYDGNRFWSYDDPEVLQEKMNYIKDNGLGGAMVWSMDGDTADGQLMSAIDTHLR
jgi:chitinase